MKDPYEVIRRPLVTEKSMTGATSGKYTFEVAPESNKIEIGNAIEKIFNVKVVKVNTLTVKGKTRKRGAYDPTPRHKEGKSPDHKKAIVTLAPGQRLEIFENM